MPIPDFQSIMLPLLKFCADGKEHSISETVDALAKQFKLTQKEKTDLLPSGKQEIFKNRLAWAKADMKMAGLLDPERGVCKITDRGIKVLKTKPSAVNRKFLKQFPEYLNFVQPNNSGKKTDLTEEPADGHPGTPDEVLQNAYAKIRQALVTDLQQRLRVCSWKFFERLVLDVILKMGYGGSLKDAGELVGKSGDEGIDGIINEDKLGLDVIYIQAKQWKKTVGRPEIQQFVGALSGKKAKKGLFITSSDFAPSATKYVTAAEPKVVLIDGTMLAELMIDNNVGVSISETFHLKKVDEDYFTEE